MKSKRLLFLYFSLLIVVAVAMSLLAGSMATDSSPMLLRDYDQIKEEGVLRIATEYNQAGYYVAGDTVEGFQYELGKAIARLSGLEVEMYPEAAFAENPAAFSGKACDVIAGNAPVTTHLRNEYLFTDAVILNKQILVQRTAKANDGVLPLRNQLELAKKTIHVSAHSPSLLRLRNLEQEIGDTIRVVEVEADSLSAGRLIAMVARGEIDYAVCDQLTARYFQRQFPGIDIQTDISFTQIASWAVRKESPMLLDSLNGWLRQIRESGLYNEIYERYYSPPTP
jgi:membrane-bound lytic murein transglycosylase MltF